MKAIAFMTVLSLALLSMTAIADIPGLINYQGTLTDDGGVALDTTLSMTFSIYNDSTAGSVVWTENQSEVFVSTGIFNVLLGSVNSIPDTVFNSPERWLGVQVGSGAELHPRQRIASVGYAFRAAGADSADYARSAPVASDGDWTIDGDNIYRLDGKIGIGRDNPSTKLDVVGNTRVQGCLYVGQLDSTESVLNIYNYDVSDWELVASSDADRFDIREYGGSPSLSIAMGGKVGVGVTNPVSRLHVKGDINVDSLYRIEGNAVLCISDPQNTFLGVCAGLSNTGFSNTFAGHDAGRSNTTGHHNTFVGCDAGSSNTIGDWGTFIGEGAGFSNTTGNGNTYLGYTAGYSNTTGGQNTFVGKFAGYSNTTGSGNTFSGWRAGFSNTGGYENSSFGMYAGHSNTDGFSNTFVGHDAGRSNTTGHHNTFVGCDAGSTSSIGDWGTFIGEGAGFSNTTGNGNTFVGYRAGTSNATGGQHTFVGKFSGYSNTTGTHNTFLGWRAGFSNATGNDNVFIGFRAGDNETGSNKFIVANGPDTSDVLIYGDFSTTQVGLGTMSPARTLHIDDVMRLEPRSSFPSSPSDGDLCVQGMGGSRHIYCYLNGGWRQLD